jgi:hypothetical protein
MIECPHCSLANPDRAQRFDCGWDFTSSRMRSSLLPPNDPTIKRNAPWWTNFLIEIAVLPVALLVWLLRHSPWLVLVIVLAAPLVALLGGDKSIFVHGA